MAKKRVAKKQPKKQSTKRQASRRQVAKKQPRGIPLFWRETRSELRKVSWPTRTEAINLTKVVVIVMVVMAIFLGGVDFLFFRFFGILFGS